MKRRAEEKFVLKRKGREHLRKAKCGTPQCVVCHGEKVFGIPTVGQLKADRQFQDQLEETWTS